MDKFCTKICINNTSLKVNMGKRKYIACRRLQEPPDRQCRYVNFFMRESILNGKKLYGIFLSSLPRPLSANRDEVHVPYMFSNKRDAQRLFNVVK